MNKKYIILLTTIIVSIIFISALGGRAARASGPSAEARWEATIQLDPEAARLAIQDRAAWTEALRIAGISTEMHDGLLSMSGQRDLDQLSTTLYDAISPWTDFLGGGVDLEIYIPSDGETITLNLEARNSTGYLWQVVGGDFTRQGESSFIMRSRGKGTPYIQSIRLSPTRTGDSAIKLTYRRPWEPISESHAKVTIWLRGSVTQIDLSDPTPSVVSKAEPPSEKETNAYASLDEIKTALPTHWDWRTKGIVPPVRDQGSCGSCWAFGTVGVMESAVKKGGGPLPNLSEQYLISCNKDGWGCKGGLTATKYHFDTLGKFQSLPGAVLESTKPYIAGDGICTKAYSHPYKASGWQFITPDEWSMPTTLQIKNAIYTYGPITAGVCVDNGWSYYSGGVYNPPAGTADNVCGGYTNHQIVLVGWDDATYSWILRNSWGSSWGEAGYMRIRWDAAGLKSRVGEGTSWVRYVDPTVPVLVSPSGIITDTTPTFKWKKVAGATQYRFQVYRGTTLVYTKIAGSTTCGLTYCGKTPAVVLPSNKYKWRAQAAVGGVWKTYSSFKTFTVAPPP